MPRPCCIIPDCNGETRVSLFQAPPNPDRRSQWKKAVCDAYPDLDVGKHFILCEKHFRRTDFTKCITDTFGNIITEMPGKKNRLKNVAVPYFDVPRLDSVNSTKKTLIKQYKRVRPGKIVQESTSQQLVNTTEPSPKVIVEVEIEPLMTVKSEPPELLDIKKEIDNNDDVNMDAPVDVKKEAHDMEIASVFIKQEVDDMEYASVVVKKEIDDDMDVDETSSKDMKEEPSISDEVFNIGEASVRGVRREYIPRGRKPRADTWIPATNPPLAPATLIRTNEIVPEIIPHIAPKGKDPITSSKGDPIAPKTLVPTIPTKSGKLTKSLAKSVVPKIPTEPFGPGTAVGKTKIIPINSKDIPKGAVPLIPLKAGDSSKIPIPPFNMPADFVKNKIIPVKFKDIPKGAVPLIPLKVGDPKSMLPSVAKSRIRVLNGEQLQVLNPGPSNIRTGAKPLLVLCPDGTTKALSPVKPPPQILNHRRSMVQKNALPMKRTQKNIFNSSESESCEECDTDEERPRKSEKTAPWYITKVTKEEIIQNREKNLKDPKYLNAPLKCEHCATYFDGHDQIHMKNLQMRHAGRCYGQSKENAEFACYVCGCSFDSVRLYNLHFRHHSVGCHAYQCSTCEFTTRRCRAMETHQCPNEGGEKVPPKDPAMKLMSTRRQYYCPTCNFMSTYSLGVIKAHYQRLHKGVEVKCEVCGHLCRNQLTYKSHMKIKHEKKPVAFCAPCKKPFYFARVYLDHLNTAKHATDEQLVYQCGECPKKFHLEIRFKKHQKFHQRVRERRNLKLSNNLFRKFICDHCGIYFPNKRKLIAHLATVSDQRPFNCQFCDLTFKRSAQLQNHIKWKHKDNTCVGGRFKNYRGKKGNSTKNSKKDKSREHEHKGTEEHEHNIKREHEHSIKTEDHEHSMEAYDYKHGHYVKTEETEEAEEHKHKMRMEEHEHSMTIEKHEHFIKTEELEHNIKTEEY